MKKVLQISVEGNRGSIGRLAENLGFYLKQRGWESYIAYGRYPRQSKSNLYRIGSDLETFLHVVETRLLGQTGRGSRFATKRLIRYMRRLNPDIIHLHHLHGYFVNYEILFDYLKTCGKPVIWTFHDCWSFTGHCPYFELAACEKWKSLCDNCPQIHKYPKSLFLDSSRNSFLLKKRVFNSVNNLAIITVSKWLEGKVRQSFLRDHYSLTIYNGVDANFFSIIEKERVQLVDDLNNNDKFIILGVANTWEERKGLADFIKLADLLNEDEVILLVGINSILQHSLPKNILVIERTENLKALAYIYQNVNVYCNFSVEETFGLTTAEAQASGTPVIVYNSSANPELVDESVGFIVEPGDHMAVRQAIDTIKRNTKQFYIDNCKKRAHNNYRDEVCFSQYKKLYEELV